MTVRKGSKAKKSRTTPVAKAIEAPDPEVNPTQGKDTGASAAAGFPIVGIGASAGGLAAFEAFFSGMPATSDPGMAFVLVQHLAPDHKSLLTELVRRYTRMQVFEVEDGMPVQINCVYIIPPNRDMAFLNGALQLLEPGAPRGHRLPIDFFFRSLAQDQHERAIGIVLSGTGSDGTQGVRAIKGEGGMVMAQTPQSTEFDGMPRSAIATGLVDFELPSAKMAIQLIGYTNHAFGKSRAPARVPAPRTESALSKIFVLLRAQTKHDFSLYKPSTMHRRIERRMAVHQIGSIEGYVKYLQQTPVEVEALFRDLLIGVTHFFRDPEAFESLERDIIPSLFEGKPAGAAIRIWVTGCSTGEEAYSIAILLQERLEALKQGNTIQVFATDIDAQAIAAARAGRYPASIAADISPERLARFFTAEPGGDTYRIHKGTRDLLVFSEQSVIKDPPFSKLDLISCRNLLIYLSAELQKKLMSLFHYALNPGGFLFLGSSETVGEEAGLFEVLDRKSKLYQRKDALQAVQRAPLGRGLPTPGATAAALAPGAARVPAPEERSLRELAEQAILRQAGSVGALVNAQGDILYLHGRTGAYLEPAPGETGVSNILKMAREGLRRELSTTLRQAVATNESARARNLRFKTNGHFSTVDLSVTPAAAGAGDSTESALFLVLLEDVAGVSAPGPGQAQADGLQTSAGVNAAITAAGLDSGGDAGLSTVALRQALRAKKEYLQDPIDELETSTEELKSSNEEMQTVNEELQSTNEELETSKEELQSVNEELATVNAELQSTVVDLSRANNDMNNLLAGTGIGTVFVDFQLRILRFTPAASRIINLIAGDVGRPVGHILPNLVGYDRLVADTQAVLNTLVPKELEVQTTEGRWYTLRIQPYRTLDNVIEGAVISFIDIAEIVQTREALLKANDLLRLAVVVRDSHDAITVQDLEGRILAWNPGAVRMYGWTEAEALAMNVRDRIPQDLREEALATLHQLSRTEILQPYHTQRITKEGAVLEVSMVSTALLDATGKMYAIATTERAKDGGAP